MKKFKVLKIMLYRDNYNVYWNDNLLYTTKIDVAKIISEEITDYKAGLVVITPSEIRLNLS